MSLALGVFYHWLGGLAAASFYIPYRAVQRWSWETYWLVGGFFSWIVAPSLIGALLLVWAVYFGNALLDMHFGCEHGSLYKIFS